MRISKKILSMIMVLLLIVGMLPISTLMVSAAVNDIFDDPASGLRFKVLTENGSIGTVSVEDGSYTGSSYTIPKEVTHNGIVYALYVKQSRTKIRLFRKPKPTPLKPEITAI